MICIHMAGDRVLLGSKLEATDKTFPKTKASFAHLYHSGQFLNFPFPTRLRVELGRVLTALPSAGGGGGVSPL